jgi:hypothetical protein
VRSVKARYAEIEEQLLELLARWEELEARQREASSPMDR